MMSGKKVLSVGTAAMLVLMALMVMAPAATADNHSEQGNLSRTFTWYGWLDFQTDNDAPGIGWFDPDDRNNDCLFRLFGLPVGSGFYYDTFRIVAGEFILQEHVPEIFLPTGCPFSTADDDSNVGWTEFGPWVGPGVTQSHILCVDTFELCTPKVDTAVWVIALCENGVAFEEGDMIGAFTGFGSPATGSSAIDCGPTDPEIMDVSEALDPETGWQSSDPVPLPQFSNALSRSSHYLVSCYQIEYERSGEQGMAQSHDWVLNTGIEDAGDAVLVHLDNDFQGVYDLSGDNECPFDLSDRAQYNACGIVLIEPALTGACVLPTRCENWSNAEVAGEVRANGAMDWVVAIQCGGKDVADCPITIGQSGGTDFCNDADPATAGWVTCTIRGENINALAWDARLTCSVI